LPPRREQYPAGGVDLGVAHGIAAAIPFLARVQAVGAADVHDLLSSSVQWLLAHGVETEFGATIPYYVAPGVEPAPARLAWCYGDPGVAAALLLAAHETAQPAWADAATRLALGAAERPPAESGVVDAGFCHGSAGLAHLFNRMYQATGEPRLRDAALFWLDQTLERLAAEEHHRPEARAEHHATNGDGLLEGRAGVALALLAATTSYEPVWDRMFLVSTRR
jgi:lantibiotic biosynthesis protein